MSTDLAIIFGTLGAYALLVLCLVFLMTRGHQRMDEVVTGLVNGVPIPTKYRWILIFYDFWGYVWVGAMLLVSFALGLRGAADLADGTRAKAVATFCAATWYEPRPSFQATMNPSSQATSRGKVCTSDATQTGVPWMPHRQFPRASTR